jgi:hypothetical protein
LLHRRLCLGSDFMLALGALCPSRVFGLFRTFSVLGWLDALPAFNAPAAFTPVTATATPAAAPVTPGFACAFRPLLVLRPGFGTRLHLTLRLGSWHTRFARRALGADFAFMTRFALRALAAVTIRAWFALLRPVNFALCRSAVASAAFLAIAPAASAAPATLAAFASLAALTAFTRRLSPGIAARGPDPAAGFGLRFRHLTP